MVTGASTAPLAHDASATAVAATPQRTRSENRRSNKPIMEKRRRARINNCLNELKYLILDAMKKDPARHSKLEKADILEMTVKHLEAMQRQQVALAAATDPNVLNKFRAGFTECAGEVGRFPGLEPPVRRRLLTHLATCLNQQQQQPQTSQEEAGVPQETPTSAAAPEGAAGPTRHSAAVQVSLVPAGAAAGILVASGPGPLQLVPTRLPNGDIALVLPSVVRRVASPPPLAAAPPTPPPSAAPSPPNPPSPSPATPPPLPLSLVVTRPRSSPPPPPTPSPSPVSPPMLRKEIVEEKPWRPW